MKIALIHHSRLPVGRYGGTERVLWWLAKGLTEAGHKVTLVSHPKTTSPVAEVLPWDFSKGFEKLPDRFDVLHFFGSPPVEPNKPYVVTIDGNGKPGETFFSNTVFVSRDHAKRHHAEAFVYNGIDPSEYLYEPEKEDFLVFLGKARWRVKNVKGAIRIAKKAYENLRIIGGSKFLLNGWNGIFWEGMIGGERKAHLLAKAKAMLFPILWEEPFGLAVIEALASGTPVLAAKRGSMPELITSDVGFLCEKDEDFIYALKHLGEIKSQNCRDRVLTHFTYHQMTQGYLGCYHKVLEGKKLQPKAPYVDSIKT